MAVLRYPDRKVDCIMKKLTSLWLVMLAALGALTGCSGDNASSVGVIGGADGPTSIITSNGNNKSVYYDGDFDEQYDDYDGQYTDGYDGQYDYDSDYHNDSHSSNHHYSNGTAQSSTSSFSASGEKLGAAVTGSEAINTSASVEQDGSYTSKNEVALYIMRYGGLPGNYMTKKEARALGWSGGSLEKFAPGKSIGGDQFRNYEGALPDKSGRTYTECDIDSGDKRGAKRIIFSNDGLIFYTEDHYETFTLLTAS